MLKVCSDVSFRVKSRIYPSTFVVAYSQVSLITYLQR
ncbi:hypothetical protein bas63_0138 [Escherichia phage JohannRWettstein]|uniref:Uncharacterized protein n=1 Tax=Escherichia phage JohannRWettstein TaxID=2852035 RepID=A0AAE7VV21_9CAUD|nr:hypothetical protein bas63_0138 [Escherichia phage JohannRWettstein]